VYHEIRALSERLRTVA